VDPRFDHQTLRVHQKMALPSFDLLSSVVATLFSPPTPVDFTDWLSTTPAPGSGSRFMRTRERLRKAACILSQVPSMRQVLK